MTEYDKEIIIDVEPEHLKRIKKILKRHIAYKTVWVFGSRVNWTSNQHSDLDLVVFDVDIVKLGELKDDFAESDLPFSVDVMSWEKIPENFRNKIHEKYVVLQRKPELEGWKECKVGTVISSNAKSINKDYPYNTIQYLDTGSITCGKIDSFQEFLLEDAPSRAKRLIKHNDIIYSTVRPIQRHYGFITNPPPNIVVSTGFSVIETKTNLAESLFIYYYLTSAEIVEMLDTIADGSTSAYPSLKPSDIENLDILLPPLPEQKAIASILSSLDDKIDLLHRQNKTLEAMAETLFRQWFVPARAGEPHAGGEEAKEGWEEKPLS